MQQSLEFSLEDLTIAELETLQVELQQFFDTSLYKTFLLLCDHNKQTMMDEVLNSSLRGVESLFTRESVMGESRGWKNMQQLFIELVEDVTTNIKRKTK